jgi:hypothetical protein
MSDERTHAKAQTLETIHRRMASGRQVTVSWRKSLPNGRILREYV